jgi:uroporphyrinogen decarboxylase
MTRRERILAAISGEKPDRPPISFYGLDRVQNTHFWNEVLRHFAAASVHDLWSSFGIEGFMTWGWCAVSGRHEFDNRCTPRGVPIDFWGNNYSQGVHGLASIRDTHQLSRYKWPEPSEFDFSHIQRAVTEIKSHDMTVTGGHLGMGYQRHHELRGEQVFYDLLDEEFMAVYLNRMTAFNVEYLDRLLTAGRGQIDIIRADDDVGSMDRLTISPEMWKRYYKPCWAKCIEVVHSHGARLWMHSCGYVWPLLDDHIENGIDCWNPFPDYVKDNDHASLAEYRRGRLALDGGVSHFTFINGSPQEVRLETEKVLQLFAKDGGLLIGPTQALSPDMQPSNLIAFFEYMRDCR